MASNESSSIYSADANNGNANGRNNGASGVKIGDTNNAGSSPDGKAKLSRRQRQRRNKKERIARERAQAKQENLGEAAKGVPVGADNSGSNSASRQPQRQNMKNGGNVIDRLKKDSENSTVEATKDSKSSDTTVSQDDKISRTKARRLRRKRKKQQYREEAKGSEIDTGNSLDDECATQSTDDPISPRNEELTDATVSPEKAKNPESSLQKPATEAKYADGTTTSISNEPLSKAIDEDLSPSKSSPEPVEASPVVFNEVAAKVNVNGAKVEDNGVTGATSHVSVEAGESDKIDPSETPVLSKAATTKTEVKPVSSSKMTSSDRSDLAYAEEPENESENCECQACSMM